MTYSNITVNRINFISLQVQLQLLFKMYETEPVFEHFSDTFTEKLVTDTQNIEFAVPTKAAKAEIEPDT